jgi:hypothetical protein
MVHSGHTIVSVTTLGTFSAVPSLEVQWDGSLMYNQWIRISATNQNGGAPCDKSRAGQGADNSNVPKVASLAGSRRVTLDTSVLANSAQVHFYYAVCYATGAGDTSDATWHDSGIRLRFVRWSNPAKHRIVTGAPVRLTFSVNAGFFDRATDKVAILHNKTDCSTAPSALVQSDGYSMKRTMDYICSKVHTDAASNCDTNFDGTYSEKCVVGGLCNPANANNGGCGSGANGVCTGSVQLPTGKSYHEIQDTATSKEVALKEGTYAICVCLGTAANSGWQTGFYTNGLVSSSSYGPANGDGACNTENEFTLVFSSTTPGRTVKVISEPQLGRFADAGGQLTLRAVAGMSFKYNIKAKSPSAGYQVANGDKIYFAPAALGCGHSTKYSGAGTHVWNYETNAYVSTGVDRRWRTQMLHVCTAIGTTNVGTNCDTNFDGYYTETCVVGAACNTANGHNGGCGAGGPAGVCGSAIPAADTASAVAPMAIANYAAGTLAADFSTPSGTPLTTVQTLVACYATSESLAGAPTDNSDYVPLTHGLEVIATPRLGPLNAPGNIHALENSSPSFVVNSMKAQDMYYFMPHRRMHPANDDCVPTVCTAIGGSNIGTNCDSTFNGAFVNTCAIGARCNTANPYHGGCGTTGKCEARVPTTGTSMWTSLIEGTGFATSGNHKYGQLTLPTSPKLAVPAVDDLPTSFYLVTCMIPAGAIKTLYTNVKKLDDKLTVFKEPTDSLVNSWYQYQVHELAFTRPQMGVYYPEPHSNAVYIKDDFTTGKAGDIVVLKKNDCNNVHAIKTTDYLIGSAYSAKFTLAEAGGEVTGDEKGGVAGVKPLAIGKVNELSPGIYKICYATKASQGESQNDFKMLAKTIEILPTPATMPKISVPRSVILGQDIVVSWASNIDLQTRLSQTNSWLGLFKKGDCSADTENRHECYKAFQFITAHQNTGTVIFSQTDYKISGEYEIRYFVGDTRNGQGKVCRGQKGVPSETYVHCVLEAAATSETITVLGSDINDTEELKLRPGLEAVFGSGNRGRYHRTKLS